MATQRVYRVVFYNQGNVYEIYAKQVSQGAMFGFIEVEGLLFNERSKIVIDPNEDRLRSEFEGVQRFFVPMHSVVRIDEVEREGTARITSTEGGKVASFPVPIYTPRGSGDS
ncbi:MAG TPA: DUF1820 family protein [Thermoanaerobaculia bacterium]|nr:DUF1820 family protein [Thermoanaerobaculia bacterium]